MCITADFVLYDSDARTGATSKDKMLAWASSTDRYDTRQGGRLSFSSPAPGDGPQLVAPLLENWRAHGEIGKWRALSVQPATIDAGAAVMTDAGSAGLGIQGLMYTEPTPQQAAFTLAGERFGNNGELLDGCSLYPGSGFAILRDRLAPDALPPVDGVGLTMTYGPYGGGHGHPDKLSVVLYADGKQWVPDFGSCAYESAEKAQWTAHTVSHNTVVVDGISQYPAGEEDKGWPADSFSRRAIGELEWFHADDLVKAAQAYCDSVYEGVELRRLSAIVGDHVLDFFQLHSVQEHVYDYPLHIAGELAQSSVPLEAREGAMGPKCGYQHIANVRHGTAQESVMTSWKDDSGRSLQVHMKAAPGDEVLVGDGYTNSPDRLMPVLMLRRRAADTVFATCIAPPVISRDADVAWLDAGPGLTAARVPCRDGDRLVLYSPTGEGGGLDRAQFRGQLLVAGEKAASVVGGTMLRLGDLRLAWETPASLQVRSSDGNEVLVSTGLQAPGKVRVGGGWTVQATAKDGAWVPVETIAAEGGTQFPAAPRALYRLSSR